MTTETLMNDAAQAADAPVAETLQTDAPVQQESAQNPAVQDQAAQDQAAQDKPAADKPQGAPESYSFAAPEGVTFDDVVIDAFSEVARDLNLPQDQAQKVLDKMAPVMAQRQAEQIAAVRSQWETEARADKEFGGENLNENLAVAKRAMDAFATPELKTLLNESGLGNHPEIIRAFYRAGKAISEDPFIPGAGKHAPQQGDARRLYNASNMNP